MLLCYTINYNNMNYKIEYELESDGRWIAEIPELPGAMVYGRTPDEATAKVISLALRVVAEKIENENNYTDNLEIKFAVSR
ncbi:MAG: hypothetical protein QG635_1103 [Bacteroidota bacterium]|nr:hypothetical protein [Bacteroidota bacterium]